MTRACSTRNRCAWCESARRRASWRPACSAKSRLERIEVDPENPFLASDGLAVYDKGKAALLALAVPCERYEVASTCVGVAKKAFCGFSGLKDVTLPAGTEVIGPFAFAHTGLVFFRAPRSLAHIGERAFFDAKSLREVDLGDGLKTVACHAFTSTALRELEMPASIEDLGNPVADRCGLVYSGADATFRIAEGSRVLRLDEQGAFCTACATTGCTSFACWIPRRAPSSSTPKRR